MFSFRSLMVALSCMALLWCLESCTTQIMPEVLAVIEPDTANSFLKAVITVPEIANQNWVLYNLDTLSHGLIGGFYSNGTAFVRKGSVVKQKVACAYYPESPQRIMRIIGQRAHNFTLTWYQSYNNQIDSLCSWQEEKLSFIFSLPQIPTLPITIQKVSSFEWSQSYVKEQYVPGNTTSSPWYITTLYGKKVNVLYQENSLTDILYRSTVESVSITIDTLDFNTKRISGRFSFRVIGSINKEVIEIQDGVFSNVQIF
jgi:hypothetical protein